MNNIVIVEDRLKIGISLAEQFAEWSKAHPELQVEVSDICYFCPNEEQAKRDIQEVSGCGFNIKRVEWLGFNEIMDQYIHSNNKRTFLVIDYILADDGSEGVPTQRINIRYARNKGRLASKRLWFYTATGTTNQSVLCQLVGEDHVFNIAEVDAESLRLHLDNDNFISALKEGSYEEV